MKKNMIVLAGALLLQIAAFAGQEGFGTPGPTKSVPKEQNLFCQTNDAKPQIQNTIVPVGTKVFVVAPTNASTGYSWVTKEGLEPVQVITPQPMMVGSGSYVIYELPVTEGTKTFKFEYKRGWEKTKAAASTCVLTVTVK